VTELALANDLVTYAFQGKTFYGALVDYTVLLIFAGAFLLLSALRSTETADRRSVLQESVTIVLLLFDKHPFASRASKPSRRRVLFQILTSKNSALPCVNDFFAQCIFEQIKVFSATRHQEIGISLLNVVCDVPVEIRAVGKHGVTMLRFR
jgi:hypothetical protein